MFKIRFLNNVRVFTRNYFKYYLRDWFLRLLFWVWVYYLIIYAIWLEGRILWLLIRRMKFFIDLWKHHLLLLFWSQTIFDLWIFWWYLLRCIVDIETFRTTLSEPGGSYFYFFLNSYQFDANLVIFSLPWFMFRNLDLFIWKAAWSFILHFWNSTWTLSTNYGIDRHRMTWETLNRKHLLILNLRKVKMDTKKYSQIHIMILQTLKKKMMK